MVPFFCSTLTSLALAVSLHAQAPTEADYYPITQIPIPEDLVMEVSGIERMPNKRIAVASRRGDIYTLTGAYDAVPDKVTYAPFAIGLHESLGLSYHQGSLYATQRPEVTRMKDEDGDGRADTFETISSDWGICGDYHEYAFGSRHDQDGNIWVVLCLTGSGGTRADYRGWCVRVTPDGKMIPTASGIRSPGGIGANHLGDMFYTDNQGPWNGSSSLKHLKVGSFQGNPAGNVHYQLTDAIGPRPPDPKSDSRIVIERTRIPELVPPACVLPHGTMGNSPAGIAYDDSEGKFGPFSNQLFVAEQTASQVQRVFLEQVNGVYQGACFPFVSGFKSGNVAIRFGENGCLFNGGTDRGWGSRGGHRYALERLDWTGKVPFEIHEIRAQSDGFELTFTLPADDATLLDKEAYEVESYTYIYQSSYGSPVVDQTKPTITEIRAGESGNSVRLVIDGLVKGNIHEIRPVGVRTKDGAPLLHPVGYYTLNEIPPA